MASIGNHNFYTAPTRPVPVPTEAYFEGHTQEAKDRLVRLQQGQFNKQSTQTAMKPIDIDGPTKAAKKEDDGFSFGDFLDIINPLHHIPVIGAIYRNITGDEIDPEARMIGGGLFGGVLGLALASADVGVEETTGKSVGEHTMAALGISPEESVADEVFYAGNKTPEKQMIAGLSKDTIAPEPVMPSFMLEEDKLGVSALQAADPYSLFMRSINLEQAVEMKRAATNDEKPQQKDQQKNQDKA